MAVWRTGWQESKTRDRETSYDAATVVRARDENQNSSGEEDPLQEPFGRQN